MKLTCLATALAVSIFSSPLANAQDYLPVGPQTGVPVATVTGGGWTQCYLDLYSNSGVPIPDILDGCPGERLMLACRETGSDTLALLAQAPREDVLTDTGFDNDTHDANGTGWYFNDDWSWGFAAEGDPVDRFTCDSDSSGSNDQRLCWHTSSGDLAAGWRCGETTFLNASSAWERVIYDASSSTAVALDCVGFEPPMDELVSVRRPNRIVPFKMQVFDAGGMLQSDADITPPVIQIDYDSTILGGPEGEELNSAGRGDEGNRFSFDPDDGTWQFNLGLKGLAEGSYIVTAVSGESELYTLAGCEGMFEIQ